MKIFKRYEKCPIDEIEKLDNPYDWYLSIDKSYVWRVILTI